MKNYIKLSFILIIVSIITSCAGGRIAIVAPNLEYPVSTTSGLYNKDFIVLDNQKYEFINSKSPSNKKYDSVDVEFDDNGEFIYTETRWSILWTIFGFSSYEKDVSEPLNMIMRKYDADGVVEFRIAPKSTEILTFFGTFIPIIPTNVIAEMRGKLIKLKK